MNDKIIIVTGAFGALGREVARTLETRGARVVRVDAAASAPDGLAGADLVPGIDLTDYAATQAMVAGVVARHGALDALVNIAGGFRWETVSDGEPATWELLHSLNLRTALHACKASLPYLIGREGARIVNIGAAAAAKAAAGMGAYAASKAAVLRLTEALAEETKDRGLNVNAVLPGIIDTPANRADMPDADTSRWVTPQALADVVAFLLSDAARAITGVGIPVTGRL
ncbi:SDR family NAD(P)-dependent oxidoreductase [Ideonella sp. B508-1]|uniref:SDR family NAD(P)-dependent oxidoreductase n=1 Tax=Ideonella sp. B508-1 TaxID=137716 RepID=UPI00034C188B|nr:SDR family NAD(P)-dependent oxidoreductase [Ideonella sp. B508-1]